MKKLLLILVLAVMCSSVARANDLVEGILAHTNGDYATAYKVYSPLAMEGNAHAQSNLGSMYDKGEGVTQDFEEAMKWYRKAAEQGSTSAQYKLGAMYSRGDGPLQDYVRAQMWFILATNKGGDEKIKMVRDLMAKQMTPVQIAEAQKMARECVKKNYKNCE